MSEVDCDASNVGIDDLIPQKGQPIVSLVKKSTIQSWNIQLLIEFYAIIQALTYWNHYLLPKRANCVF